MNSFLTNIARKTLILAFFILSGFCVAHAQNFFKKYKHAKSFFNDAKYNLAMEAFRPLMVYDKNNKFVEYSYFFYAQSAIKLEYYNVAKDALIKIVKYNSEWEHIREINYWLAKIYFIQGNYFRAMSLLREVKTEDYIDFEDVVLLKRQYLSNIDDIEILRMLWEDFPEDREIPKAIKGLLVVNRLKIDNVNEFFDDLAREHDEIVVNKLKASLLPEIRRERYKVSVLFPFWINSIHPTRAKIPNQRIIDLYEGMRMANDTLAKMKIFVDLFAYDTEGNPSNFVSEKIENLLLLDELQNTDCIVGPLFSEEIKLMKDFSKQHQIKMINPISNNSNYIKDNENAFLFQPSYETIGSRAAELIALKSKNKNCMVFYGDLRKDSLLAASFISRAIDLGLNIVFAKEFERNSTLSILSILTSQSKQYENDEPSFDLKKDSVGSIFVATNNPLIYTKIISSVESRGDSIIIVGNESWLDNMSVDFLKFERLKILLASPNYTNFNSYNYLNFRNDYIKAHGSYPAEYLNYSKLGFDFMMWLGKVLHNYGTNFEVGLRKDGAIANWLTKGYKLSDNRDNSILPFIYFYDGQLIEIE